MELTQLSNQELAELLHEKILRYEESGRIQIELLKQVKEIRDEIQELINEIEKRDNEEIRTESH